jgi:DNA-directed RNA polymerase subunit RPC12/RpoP
MTMADYTCEACGTEFSTNCLPGDIECPECEARLCSDCGHWDERPS